MSPFISPRRYSRLELAPASVNGRACHDHILWVVNDISAHKAILHLTPGYFQSYLQQYPDATNIPLSWSGLMRVHLCSSRSTALLCRSASTGQGLPHPQREQCAVDAALQRTNTSEAEGSGGSACRRHARPSSHSESGGRGPTRCFETSFSLSSATDIALHRQEALHSKRVGKFQREFPSIM